MNLHGILEMAPKQASLPIMMLFIIATGINFFFLFVLYYSRARDDTFNGKLFFLTIAAFIFSTTIIYQDFFVFQEKAEKWQSETLIPYLEKETAETKVKEVDKFYIKELNKQTEAIVYLEGEKEPIQIQAEILTKEGDKTTFTYNTLDPLIEKYFKEHYKTPKIVTNEITNENIFGYDESVVHEVKKVEYKHYEKLLERQVINEEILAYIIFSIYFLINFLFLTFYIVSILSNRRRGNGNELAKEANNEERDEEENHQRRKKRTIR